MAELALTISKTHTVSTHLMLDLFLYKPHFYDIIQSLQSCSSDRQLFFGIRQHEQICIQITEWFWMESLGKNIQLMREFLKAPFLVLYFSYYTLMTFLMMLVKWGKNETNLTNLSIIRYLLWPSLPHFLVLIHWSLAFMNK